MTNFQFPLFRELADEHRRAIQKEFARHHLAAACAPAESLYARLGVALVRFGTWLERKAYHLQERQVMSQLYVQPYIRSTGELRS